MDSKQGKGRDPACLCRETFLGSPTKSVDVLSAFQEVAPREVEVQPLQSRAPRDVLMDQDQQDLPQASLLEHFERAPPLPLFLQPISDQS